MRLSASLLGIWLMAVAVTTLGSTKSLPTFQFLTEEWRPYNFTKDNVPQGIAVDMLIRMLDKVGSKQGRLDIKVYPWARAYDLALHTKNAILFTTTRNKAREELFKWVGPIFKNTLHLYALKKNKIKINEATDLHRYKIATYIDDAAEHTLINLYGFNINNLNRSGQQVDGIKRVYYGRNDLFAAGPDTLNNLSKEIGVDRGEFESVFLLSSNDMSYAFHSAIPDEYVQIFQKAFDELKSEGVLDKLFEKYLEL